VALIIDGIVLIGKLFDFISYGVGKCCFLYFT